MAKIPMSALLIAGALAPAMLSFPQMSQSHTQNQQMGAQARDMRKTQAIARLEANQRLQGSPVALARAEVGCTLVYGETAHGLQTMALAEGTELFEISASDGQYLADGAYACTENGFTAESRGGTATNVLQVARKDMDDFLFLIGKGDLPVAE